MDVDGCNMRKTYTKVQVVEVLKKTGRLTTAEISEHPELPNIATVKKLFQTKKIKDVWKELGMAEREQPPPSPNGSGGASPD